MSNTRKYRQLKDSPTHPAGTVWIGDSTVDYRPQTKYEDMSKYGYVLFRENVENNPDWFEEIKDDEWQDGIWYLGSHNDIQHINRERELMPPFVDWNDSLIRSGNAYSSREEAEHEKARRESLREAKVKVDQLCDMDGNLTDECGVILTMPFSYLPAWRALAERNPKTK